MTDLERFLKLYKSFGVYLNYEIIQKDKLLYYNHLNSDKEFIIIVIDKNSNYSFAGYNNFCTEVIFSVEGKFLTQGFWE